MVALTRRSIDLLTVSVLVALVVVSALAAVYIRHEARERFIQLQALLAEQDRLRIEWGRLQIELGTIAGHGQIEQRVRSGLDMIPPPARDIQIIFGP